MFEFLATVAVFVLAAGGLGAGLVFGRGPAKTSCGALPEDRCRDCPLRRQAQAGETSS